MRNSLLSVIYLLLFYLGSIQAGKSQKPTATKTEAREAEVYNHALFNNDEILWITLRGNIKALLKDRTENSTYFPVNLSYSNTADNMINLEASLKTRGHFRKLKGNCVYPPLTIKFPKTNIDHTIFKGQNKLKLVMPCRGDEYIIKEWLVYKLYNLITPLSFKARLVKVTIIDEENRFIKEPFYAFILEDENQMAQRNKMQLLERNLQPEEINTDAFLMMAVFQYLIANTDWSTQYQQNIKLLTDKNNAAPIAVPYDFDHAGIVEAPYAEPFEALKMKTIRERRYRGYCMNDLSKFTETIKHFNRLKNDIYNLYLNCQLVDEKYKKRTIIFLDAFYKTINNKKEWQKEFSYPCDKNGSGNVVIKGLKQ